MAKVRYKFVGFYFGLDEVFTSKEQAEARLKELQGGEKMKYISFTLSMPQRNSWNGRWSGEDNLYCKIVKTEKFTKKHEDILNKSFYYDFGDGWGACIKVKEVTRQESTALKKKSKGFCGYEWMIASILRDGVITYDPNWQSPHFA